MAYLYKLDNFLTKNKINLYGKSVLAAVSGGSDSVFLLHLLLSLQKQYKINLGAAYFNHKIREASDDEQIFVENMCRDLNIPFFYGINKISDKEASEGTLRNARYSFLQAAAAQKGFDFIATAHNADDNAETILMRIIRGTYLGLKGIPPKNKNIIRPALCFTKNEIMRYIHKNKLTYIVDPSNYSSKYMRNKVRNEIMPLLKGLNNNVVSNLNSISNLANEDNIFFEKLIQTQNMPTSVIPTNELNSMGTALKNRFILRNVKKLSSTENIMTAAHFNTLENFKHSKMLLKNNITIEESSGYTFFYKRLSIPPQKIRLDTITIHKKISFSAFSLIFEIKQPANTIFNDSFFFSFDFDLLKFPLFLRTREKGDKINLFPAGTAKKVKEIMINYKIPRPLRAAVPILTDADDKILCIPGLCRSNTATISSSSKKILVISLADNILLKKLDKIAIKNVFNKLLVLFSNVQNE